MSKIASDLIAAFRANHKTVKDLVADMEDSQWVKKPGSNINNIASIIEHVALVEQKVIAVIAGDKIDVNPGAPFAQTSWNVHKIKMQLDEVLDYAVTTLGSLTDGSLTEVPSGGKRTRLELAVNVIAHTAHHRGQIPIIKKLIVE